MVFLTKVNDMYAKDPPTQVLYFYGIHQDLFGEMERSMPIFIVNKDCQQRKN